MEAIVNNVEPGLSPASHLVTMIEPELIPVEDPNVQYGKTEDGDYITPYLTTIMYNHESVLQTTIAALLDRVQLVPTGAAYKHLSPDLVVFDDVSVSDYLSAGFQRVLVYCGMEKPEDCVDDPRVTYVTANELQIYCKFAPSPMLIAYMLDLVLCREYAGGGSHTYTSLFDGVSAETGRAFITALSRDCANSSMILQCRVIGHQMRELLTTSYRGFDIIHDLIRDGETILATHTRLIQRAWDFSSQYEVVVMDGDNANTHIVHVVNIDAPFDEICKYAVDSTSPILNIVLSRISCELFIRTGALPISAIIDVKYIIAATDTYTHAIITNKKDISALLSTIYGVDSV